MCALCTVAGVLGTVLDLGARALIAPGFILFRRCAPHGTIASLQVKLGVLRVTLISRSEFVRRCWCGFLFAGHPSCCVCAHRAETYLAESSASACVGALSYLQLRKPQPRNPCSPSPQSSSTSFSKPGSYTSTLVGTDRSKIGSGSWPALVASSVRNNQVKLLTRIQIYIYVLAISHAVMSRAVISRSRVTLTGDKNVWI